MSSNLECLKGNLQTLYTAAHCSADEPMLIGDWSGTNLLLKGVGPVSWIWSQFYDKAPLLGYQNLEQEKKHAALLFTRSIFSEGQQLAITAQLDYQDSLQMLIRNEQVPDEKLRAARETLSAWHSATKEWTKFLKTQESQNITNWLNEHSQNVFQEPYFFSNEVLEESARLRRFYKIIAVDGHLQMTFAPLLFKAACSQPLEKKEKKNLQALSLKIDSQSDSLGVQTFDKALQVLNDFFKNENPAASLVAMKMALINAKCNIFFQKDVNYFDWRNALQPESTVFWGNRQLTLGEQLGEEKDPKEDRNRVFTVVGDTSIVLSFGVNRALHDLRMEMRKKCSWALKSVKCLDVDVKGRFAVIRRLMDPVADIQWKSQKKLVSEDLAIVTPIANLVGCFLQQNKMFIDFSADNIMFNEKGRLTYLKLPLEGPLKFNELVRFVIRCAQENLVIYKFMIARIKDHPYAVFYEKMVENALKNVPDDPSIFAASLNTLPFFRNTVFTQSIFEQGSSLREQIIDLKEECLGKINESYQVGQRKDLPDLVSKAILTCYRSGAYIGLLPDTFNEDVMRLIEDKL